jgi:hypothetical protein
MAVKGSCVISRKSDNDITRVTCAMVADSSGDCDAGEFTAHGYLISATFHPGTAADEYDIVLNDEDDLDVLDGAGANMSNAAGMTLAEKYLMLDGPNGNYLHFMEDTLNLVGSNMGNLGTATIKFKFSRVIQGK